MRLPRSPGARALLAIGSACVGFALVLSLIDRLAPAPEGPRSSSYATSPQGMAAYAAVLERAGHPVRRLRTPIAEQRPRDGETLIILDPDSVDPDEAVAIGDWVRDGGRLIAGASSGMPWLSDTIEAPPRWTRTADAPRRPLVAVGETTGVRAVLALEEGGWEDVGALLPILGPEDAPLAVIAPARGGGHLVLLADTSPLSNRALAQADNAAFGVALAGGDKTPVAFLETVHGYGVSRGFGGLPSAVKWSLLGLALTLLVALWSAGRRLGPPEDPDTDPPPPRMQYVDALAGSLARTKDKESS